MADMQFGAAVFDNPQAERHIHAHGSTKEFLHPGLPCGQPAQKFRIGLHPVGQTRQQAGPGLLAGPFEACPRGKGADGVLVEASLRQGGEDAQFPQRPQPGTELSGIRGVRTVAGDALGDTQYFPEEERLAGVAALPVPGSDLGEPQGVELEDTHLQALATRPFQGVRRLRSRHVRAGDMHDTQWDSGVPGGVHYKSAVDAA